MNCTITINNNGSSSFKNVEITIDDPKFLIYVYPACYANGVSFFIMNNDFKQPPGKTLIQFEHWMHF